ncbi:MAG: septum formation protein Maf [Candidatus Zixiibacteriota bacterium]|nr:MAG: septum formation protein Maf [candidate division Zixibacteria bacterium]
MKIILASESPRRSKILSDMGYDFEIAIADVVEDIIGDESPSDHVIRLSSKKAERVAGDYPDDVVIGADTAVVLDGEILGKPGSEKEAFKMLSRLSGKTHTVFSGLTVMVGSEKLKRSDYDRTEVIFNDLSESRIREYVSSGEPLDKAGSYGIQGMGSFLVKSYCGEIDTVIGFPSKLFEKMYMEVRSCLNR